MTNPLTRALIGPDRKLRPLWRAALYYVAGIYLVFPLFDLLFAWVIQRLHIEPALAPGFIGLGEFRNLFTALVCTGLFAVYERRRIDSYGLALDQALRWPIVEGAASGGVVAGAVALGMIALGGLRIDGLASSGGALALSALAWFAASLSVGLAEEFWFRAYLQQTLWRSIGFWPAAIVVALIFASEHYFFKDGENIWDVITLVSLSLVLSDSIRRAGTLWFAVGFHAAFDDMQLFVIGTPNGARVPVGRLFDATFTGPAWLTGGVLGTEASFLMYPAIALLWLYVWWRYRDNPLLHIRAGN